MNILLRYYFFLINFLYKILNKIMKLKFNKIYILFFKYLFIKYIYYNLKLIIIELFEN